MSNDSAKSSSASSSAGNQIGNTDSSAINSDARQIAGIAALTEIIRNGGSISQVTDAMKQVTGSANGEDLDGTAGGATESDGNNKKKKPTFAVSPHQFAVIKAELRAQYSLVLDETVDTYVRDAVLQEVIQGDNRDTYLEFIGVDMPQFQNVKDMTDEQRDELRALINLKKKQAEELALLRKRPTSEDKMYKLSEIFADFSDKFADRGMDKVLEMFYATLAIAYLQRREVCHENPRNPWRWQLGDPKPPLTKVRPSQFDLFDEFDTLGDSISLWHAMCNWHVKQKADALCERMGVETIAERESHFLGFNSRWPELMRSLKKFAHPNEYLNLIDLLDCKDVDMYELDHAWVNTCGDVKAFVADIKTLVRTRMIQTRRLQLSRIAHAVAKRHANDYRKMMGEDGYAFRVRIGYVIYNQLVACTPGLTTSGTIPNDIMERAFVVAECIAREHSVCDAVYDMLKDIPVPKDGDKQLPDPLFMTRRTLQCIRQVELERLSLSYNAKTGKSRAPPSPPDDIDKSLLKLVRSWKDDQIVQERARLLIIVALVAPQSAFATILDASGFDQRFKPAFKRVHKEVEAATKRAREIKDEDTSASSASQSKAFSPDDPQDAFSTQLDLPSVDDIIRRRRERTREKARANLMGETRRIESIVSQPSDASQPPSISLSAVRAQVAETNNAL